MKLCASAGAEAEAGLTFERTVDHGMTWGASPCEEGASSSASPASAAPFVRLARVCAALPARVVPGYTASQNMREDTMLTRRGILLASVAAGVAMNTRAAFAKAAQPSTAVNFD